MQEPGSTVEKKVFLGYDQKSLDDAYDQSAYASNGKQISGRNAINSAEVRRRIGDPICFQYGNKEIERLEVYKTKTPDAPVLVFIHGGAWRNGRARDFGFSAEAFVRNGVHFVISDFDSVDDVNGDLSVLAGQVRRAVAWVYQNSRSFGGNPERIYVSGRSSGAHLAGVCSITDWKKEFGLPINIVKGYSLSSGMFDLRGPRLSKRGNYVKFTDEIEHDLSPQRHIDNIHAPIVLFYGSLETPEFKRQSQDFASTLKSAGRQVSLIYADGYNHFELSETIANPYGIVGRSILEQIGITQV